MAFDYEAARNDGVPDEQIAEYLADRYKFDLSSALADGVPYDQIMPHLLEQDRLADRTFMGGVGDALKRPFQGAAQTFLTAGKGAVEDVDALTNLVGAKDLISEDNAATKWIDDAQQSVGGWTDRAYDGHLSDFLTGMGSMAAFATAALLTRGRSAGAFSRAGGFKSLFSKAGFKNAGKAALKEYKGALPFAGFTGAGEAADMVTQARREGLEVSEGQEDAAAAIGTLIGFTELVPVERFLRGVNKDMVGKGFGYQVMKKIQRALINGGVEGAQELSARLMQDAAAKGIYNPDLPIGQSAWREFLIGGEVGAATDLLFQAFAGRRNRVMAKQALKDEEERRLQEEQRLAALAEQFPEIPRAEIAGLLPYLPQTDVDLNDPKIRAQAEAKKLVDQPGFSLDKKFKTEQRKMGDGTDAWFVLDDQGNQYGNPFTDPNQANMFGMAMKEATVDRVIQEQADMAMAQSDSQYSPTQRFSFREFARKLFHPVETTYRDVVVNTAAGTTIEKSYPHEQKTAAEAMADGVKYSDMTAAQRINYRRLKRGLPETHRFTKEEVKQELGDNYWRMADYKFTGLGNNERFRAIKDDNGKFVVTSMVGGRQTKKGWRGGIDTGLQIKSRRATPEENAAGITGRVEFKNRKEAREYAHYLNAKEGRLVARSDILGDDEITVDNIKSILREKGISSDINSPEVRAVAEAVTGVKARGKTTISDMSQSDLASLYWKLRSLPNLASKPSVKLPTFGLRPYTLEQYIKARNAVVERSTSGAPLTEQAMPTREEVDPKLSENAYARLKKDILSDSDVKSRIAAIQEDAAARLDNERAWDAARQKEQEAVERVIKEQFSKWGLKRVGVTLTDFLRQARKRADGTVELGETKPQVELVEEFNPETGRIEMREKVTAPQKNWSRGEFSKALNHIFVALNAIRFDKRYIQAKKESPEAAEKVLEQLALETLGHETLHAMRQADLFTQREWEILSRAASKEINPDTGMNYYDSAAALYPEMAGNPSVIEEEAIAELVRHGLTHPEVKKRISQKQKNLFRRIIEFFKSVFKMQDAVGYYNFDQIINAIESGEIAKRPDAVRSLRETERAAGRAMNKLVSRGTVEDSPEQRSYPLADRDEWYSHSDYQAAGGKMVRMSPEEFLTNAKPLQIDEVSRENIDDLKNHITSGRTLDPLTLYGDTSDVRNSDGRHRAVAAKELGIKEVPVVDFRELATQRNNDILEQRTKKVDKNAEQQAAKAERIKRTRTTVNQDRLARAQAQERGRGRDVQPQFVRGGGYRDAGGVRYIARYIPNEEYANTLNKADIAPVELLEIDNTEDAGIDLFHQAITDSRYAKGGKNRVGSLGFGAAVYVYPKAEYAKMRLFIGPNGKYGIALKPDGDVVSAFSDGGAKVYPMMALAIAEGGTKADAFDTVLPAMYRPAGFKEVGRDPWNEEYKPEGWDKKVFWKFNKGEPDVVYMEYDPLYNPYDDGYMEQRVARPITTKIADKRLKPEQRKLTMLHRIDPQTGELIRTAKNNSVLLADAIKTFQEERGNVVIDPLDPANHELLATIMAAEAEPALESHPTAIGWYNAKLHLAKRIISLMHPEVLKGTKGYKAYNEHALDYATAVTSNGMAVVSNYKHANEQYEYWKEHGKFMVKGYGSQGESMENAFRFYNAMVDAGYSQRQIIKFLNSDTTPAELRQDPVIVKLDLKSAVSSDEYANAPVKGSYVLGPKIGQGFYQNLRGNYDPVTMDRWWMRMFNRISGRPWMEVQDETLENNMISMWNSMLNADTELGIKLISDAMDNLDIEYFTPHNVLRLGVEIDKLWQREFNRPFNQKIAEFKKAGRDIKNESVREEARSFRPNKWDHGRLIADAANIRKNWKDSPQEDPRSPGDREVMRQVTNRAIEIIKEDLGIEILPADLQALLWYAEKKLFEMSGVRKGQGQDNDYADGAIALLRENGYTDEQIIKRLPPSDRYRIDPERYDRGATPAVRQKAGKVRGETGVQTRKSTAPGQTALTDDTLEQRKPPSMYVKEWNRYTGLPTDILQRYEETGLAQRGAPEIAMTQAQRANGGGVLNYVLEHGGDLSNRASPAHNYEWAKGEAKYKAENVLRQLKHPYGFAREAEENIRDNARYKGVTVEEHKAKLDKALKEYADAHKALKVYNPVQKAGRDAAVAIGEGRYDDAINHLERFIEMTQTQESFNEALSQYFGDDTLEMRTYRPRTRVGVNNIPRTPQRQSEPLDVGGFLKSWWDRNFRAKHNLPNMAFAQKIIADQNKGAENLHTEHLMKDLKKAVEDYYGKPFSSLTRQEESDLNDFLAGDNNTIAPALANRIRPMRSYLDRLSTQMITEGVVDGEVVDTIFNNVGRYLHRSYQMFDDPNWHKKVSPQVVANARQYLYAEAVAAGKIGNVELTGNQAADMALVDGFIENLLTYNTEADSVQQMFSSGRRLGQQDLTMLIKRKQIAPEIRELMGEYKDPLVNFSKSATKMQYAIANHVMLKTMMAEGLGGYLHQAPVPGFAYPLTQFSKVNGGNPLYTSPEIAKAFADVLGEKNFGDMYRTILMLNAGVKYGKTVLSVTTMARNVLSAFMFSMAGGHILTPGAFSDFANSWKTLAAELTGKDVARPRVDSNGNAIDQLGDAATSREYYRSLKRLGVTLDNPFPSEMIGAVNDAINPDNLTGKIWKPLKGITGFFTKLYQYGDDLWKIVGFESEKAALIRAGISNDKTILRGDQMFSEAEIMAADRIKNTYPTYSQIGKAIKGLRRTPIVGTFVSFPAEIIRTSVNLARTLKEDYDAGRTELVARRAVGMSVAAGWAAVLTAITKAWMGFDDDDDETIRKLSAPWMRNSNLAYAGYDQDGFVEFFDLSYLDPYNYLKRPINAILMGGDWKENVFGVRAGGGMRDLLDPFIGPDIAFSAIMEVINNKRLDGAPVYNEMGSPAKISGEIANHLRKAIQPGTAMNIERMIKATTGETSRSGTKYTMENELYALAGFRRTTMNPYQSGKYRAYDFREEKSRAARLLSYPLGGQDNVTDKEIRDAFNEMMRARERAYERMAETVELMQNIGLGPGELQRVLDSSGLSKEDVAYLTKGVMPKWRPSKQFLQNAMESAIFTSPQRKREEMKEIFRHRVRMVRELAREYYTDE